MSRVFSKFYAKIGFSVEKSSFSFLFLHDTVFFHPAIQCRAADAQQSGCRFTVAVSLCQCTGDTLFLLVAVFQ